MVDTKFKCFELSHESYDRVTFTLIGDLVHIAEWYGYDLPLRYVKNRRDARLVWNSLLEKGYKPSEPYTVTENFGGIKN